MDHVRLYMGCDEELFFKGKINRPDLNLSREFVTEDTDKVERFIERFKELAKEKNFKESTKYGGSEMNLNHFSKLGKYIMEYALCAV